MRTFHELLFDYANASPGEPRKAIEAELWQRFGRRGAVYILDMAGFSRVTQAQGIVYYLSLVRRMQIIVGPIIAHYRGQVVKFEADNCFAAFETVIDAVQAAIAINHAVGAANRTTPDDIDIVVAGGIDFGDYLLIDDEDLWGQPVNRASKLGEDLARGGEILMTEDAFGELDPAQGIRGEEVAFDISGLRLEARRIRY